MEILITSNIILSAQEVILNRYLNLDPESKAHLRKLSGKVIKVEWAPLTYYWLFKSDSIYLSKDYTIFLYFFWFAELWFIFSFLKKILFYNKNFVIPNKNKDLR